MYDVVSAGGYCRSCKTELGNYTPSADKVIAGLELTYGTQKESRLSSMTQDSPVPGFSAFAGDAPRDLAVGDLIGGRYRILAPLGGGAMGRVYLAENTAIGLHVAVKLLKPELLTNPQFRQRFQHEAEAVAKIQHANVARFLDLVVGDPTFLVMEYVSGPTLDVVLRKEGPLAPKRAVDIAVRLCWGLHAAHRAGVVHRDFKPSNILCHSDEELGELPKIIDFGLAKFATTDDTPLTRTGQIIGTPQYMAPEQIAGKHVDARTDVYALGSVLYAMLAGRPPFVGNTDDVQVLYRQVHEEAEPITRYAPYVSPELECVVARALEKEPGARFASALDFARALIPTVEKRQERRAPATPLPSDKTEVIRRNGPVRTLRWATLTLVVAVLAFSSALVVGRGVRARAMTARLPPGPDTLLLLVTEPPSAVIEIDGKPIADRTPAALHDLAPGDHAVRFSRPHYMDATRPFTLKDGSREVVQLHLAPASHAVEARTVPSGASVYLDGSLVSGLTPLSLLISDGDYHLLRIEKDGYETYEHALKPEGSAPLAPLVLTPEKLPRGTLYVDAAAPAEVWLDGSFTGFATPTPGLRIATGDHKVSLKMNGLSSEVIHAQLKQGATVRLVIPLPSRRRASP
jgi:serine/threonine protein kinase